MSEFDQDQEFVTGIQVPSDFRTWCERLWQEHLVEKEAYGDRVDYTRQQYFQQNKYWLKAQYKELRSDV